MYKRFFSYLYRIDGSNRQVSNSTLLVWTKVSATFKAFRFTGKAFFIFGQLEDCGCESHACFAVRGGGFEVFPTGATLFSVPGNRGVMGRTFRRG